jgi:hypothetical protein
MRDKTAGYRGGAAVLRLESLPIAMETFSALRGTPATECMRMAAEASNAGKAPGLFVWCTDSLSTKEVNSTTEGIAKLQGFIQRSGAEVVIIDPWRLWSGKDECLCYHTLTHVLARLGELSRFTLPRCQYAI